MAPPKDETTEPENKKKFRDCDGTRIKLIFNADVEVRSMEDGFLGSWHVAKVTGIEQGKRFVKYQHILTDDGNGPFCEWVNVTPAIDGIIVNNQLDQQNYRGNIRPLPPPVCYKPYSFSYGMCVDVFHLDAWWEGVIFDHDDGSDERKVFFPDLGDEMNFQVEKMRITQSWDEVTEEWKPRGTWIFLELIEEHEELWPILVSLKQIWYDLRGKKEFQSIRDWTSSARETWKRLLLQVHSENFKLNMKQLFQVLKVSEEFLLDDHSSVQFSTPAANSILKFEALSGDSLAIVPHPKDDSPSALSILPPDQNYISAEEVATTSLENLNERRRSPGGTHKRQWLPAGEEIVPCPEYCPDSIAAYNEMENSAQRRDLISNVRKHLAYLNWKQEYVRDGKVLRMRYTSPSGEVYYSIRSLCRVLAEGNDRNSLGATDIFVPSQLDEEPQPSTGEPNLFSNSQLATVESDLGSNPVVTYYCLGYEEVKGIRNEKVATIASKAKNYLSFIGWNIMIREKKNRKEKVYVSPTGKPFYSLRTACGWCVRNWGLSANGGFTSGAGNLEQNDGMHHEQLTLPSPDAFLRKGYIMDDEVEVHGNSKLKRKRKHNLLQPSSALDIKGFPAFDKRRENSNTEYSADVLRSDKRARQFGPSSSHQYPRTILSWLIDGNVIFPRAKVHYCSKKDRRPMKEGRITREGIRCICCQQIFTLSKFEAHAGSKYHRPSENIFLEDGRSLLECQLQLKRQNKAENPRPEPYETKHEISHGNDYVCSVCRDGGELVLCDQCPSSFHTSCLGLKGVPDGDWFCPSCHCSICGLNRFDGSEEQLTDCCLVNCGQCESRYHIQCLKTKGLKNTPEEGRFCSEECQEIHLGLQDLLGKPIPVGHDDLTLTLWKYKRAGPENEHLVQSYSKLKVALSVMHECFEPVKENRTQRDLIEDVIFSRWSDLNRLNFQGFYTLLLERDDELITVANIRVYGKKVAEMPLIATRFQYRRLGMCRILMDRLEKKLVEFGVERLVLPAVPAVLDTWTKSFGFSIMSEAERLKFLDLTFLDFQGTIMCQKHLINTSCIETQPIEIQPKFCKQIERDTFECDGSSAISEVFQADHMGKEIVQQGSGSADETTVLTDCNSSGVSFVNKIETTIQEYTFPGVNHHEVSEKNTNNIKCYRRRRRSSATTCTT